MTTTAIDTSVLIAIVKGEPSAELWVDSLVEASAGGDLVICDVVAAELFALMLDSRRFDASLQGLGISFSPIEMPAAQLAGKIFRKYRQQGGPREHLVPDFLIGAHAMEQADSIAAVDRGYLRRYFPKLKVVRPAKRASSPR